MYIGFFPWFCGFIVKCFRDVPMYVLERYINKDYYCLLSSISYQTGSGVVNDLRFYDTHVTSY